MKKRLLSGLLIGTTILTLTGCTLFKSNPVAEPLSVPEFATGATDETGDETAYEENGWTNFADNTNNGKLWHDSIYTGGVPDDFYIAKECTFDKMRADLDKVTQAYNQTDTLKRVFTVFYGSEELWYTVPDESKIWTLARLAALSYSLDMANSEHLNDWQVKFMTATDGEEDQLIFSFYEGGKLDESLWKMDVMWDYSTGKLYRQMAGEDTSNEFTVPLSNRMNSFDPQIIKSFADIINISLHGGELEYGSLGISTTGESAMVDALMPTDSWLKTDWLLFDKSTHTGSKETSEFYKYTLHEWLFEREGSEEPASEEKPAEERPASAASLKDCNYQYLKGYEDEVQKAIEDFYGSTIAEIKDKAYDTNEGAEIIMANGKKCTYFGTKDMATITDMDSYDYIWKNN